jgi:ACR3 family arsenite efflux pump ArsB
MYDFLSFLLPTYSVNLLPMFAMLAVFVLSVVLAFLERDYSPGLRVASVGIAFLLFVVVGSLVLQPFVQIYLEEELGIIFLEANKYTALMRNVRYLVYPLAMLVLAILVFDDRDEARTGRNGKGGANAS